RHPAGRSRDHRDVRRGADHGAGAQDAAAARRAVPPREHRQRERPRAAAELPQPHHRVRRKEGRMMEIKSALNKLAARQDLTGEEMRAIMTTIMTGEATPAQIGGFLMALRVKGESVGEIAAA